MHNIIIKNDVDLRSATKLHGVLVSCTEQNTKIRVPVQPGVYGIQHGAECVHDVVQTANYSAMKLHYSAGKLHGWFTSGSNSGVTFTPDTKGPVYGVNSASQGVRWCPLLGTAHFSAQHLLTQQKTRVL